MDFSSKKEVLLLYIFLIYYWRLNWLLIVIINQQFVEKAGNLWCWSPFYSCLLQGKLWLKSSEVKVFLSFDLWQTELHAFVHQHQWTFLSDETKSPLDIPDILGWRERRADNTIPLAPNNARVEAWKLEQGWMQADNLDMLSMSRAACWLHADKGSHTLREDRKLGTTGCSINEHWLNCSQWFSVLKL